MSLKAALEKMPRTQAVVAALGATFALSVVSTAIVTSIAKPCHTMTPEWQAATKEYMKFQKMNPIFGVSRSN